MTKTALVFLLLAGGLLLAATPASAAATYTFFVSGSSVGQTSPGVAKDYTLNLTNLNASVAISFNLSIVSGPIGWTTQLSQGSLTVPGGATRQITLTVQPPSTALADAVGQFVNVTATPDDNTTAQTLSTTTRVTETFGVAVTLIPQAGTSGDPGANIAWLAYVKNTGNSAQTYTVSVNNTSFTSTNLTTNLITVSPGDTRVVQVIINISTTAPVGTLYSRITATSTANSSSTDGVLFAATVNAKRAVGLSGLTPDDLHVSSESEASVVVRNIIIANLGNVADSYTLQGSANASRHGDWVSFATSQVALAAFTQIYLNVTVTVPASIAQAGDYTAEFRILSDNSTQVIAFLNLTITVVAKHDLSLVYESLISTQSGLPGGSVSYPVNVSNPGAYNQRVDLAYTGPNSAWVAISATPFTLAPGAFRIVYYNFTIPGTASPSSFNFQAAGSINWSTPARNRTVDLTLQVSQVYDTIATSSVAAAGGLPGATVAFTVSVRNNGTGPDNFTLASSNTTQAGLVTVSPASIALAAGASGNFTVSVAIALSPAPLAGVYYYTATATSSGNTSRTAAVQLALTVNQTYSLAATVTPSSATVDPGALASYTLAVTNSGNGPDTVTLQHTGANDTWVDYPVSSGTIAAGGRMNFTVTAQSPTWAPPGATLLSVAAVSGGNATVMATGTFTIFLNAQRAVAVIAAPGNIPNAHRNQLVHADITVRNSGNIGDTYTLTLDGLDASWTSLPSNTFALLGNENSTFTLDIQVPALPTNGPHTFWVNATSIANSSITASAFFNVSVNDVFRPEVSVVNGAVFALPGSTVSIATTVRNNGTIGDTLLLTVTTPVGLNQTILRNFTLAANGAGTTTNVQILMNFPYAGTYQVHLALVSQNDTNARDDAFVNITLDVRRGLRLEVPVNGDQVSGGPGIARTLSFWLNNTGNISDTYRLEVDTAPVGFAVDFSENDVTLGVGARRNITVTITAASPAAANLYSISIVGYSLSTQQAKEVLSGASLRYLVAYGHSLTNASGSPSLLPGATATVTVVLTNVGTSTDDFTILSNGTAGSWGTVSSTLVTLAPDSSTTLSIDISVPSGQHDGARTLLVEVRSARGGLLRTLPITVTVERTFGLSLAGPSAPVATNPGQAAVFAFTVQNLGNSNDTYAFVATPGQYANFSAASATADAGESAGFSMSYTPPASAAAGSLTVEVSVFGGGSRVSSMNVTVQIRQVYNVSAKGVPADTFAASGAPGTQVQLTFNITNRGNGPDTFNWALGGDAASWATQASGSTSLAQGLTTLVSVFVDIPSDPLVAVAGPQSLNVSVTSVGGGSAVSASITGAVTIDVMSAFTASFSQSAIVLGRDDSIDRARPEQRDYSIYLHNSGNRAETLQVTRAQISGWSIVILVNGVPGQTVTVPPGGDATATLRIASFPLTATAQTVTAQARTADGPAPPVTLAINFTFLEARVDFASPSVEVSPADTPLPVGSAVTVTVQVRNAGPGTASNVVVRLKVNGVVSSSSKSIPTLAADATIPVTLTYTIADGDAGKVLSFGADISGTSSEVSSDTHVTVPAEEKSVLAKLTGDSMLMAIVFGALLGGVVLGLALRGGRRAAPAPMPRPSPQAPAPSSPESAMEGLAALEAEAAAAPPAAPAPAEGGPGPQEHKIECPQCGAEQWIKAPEGECKNCGVIIEISEAEDDSPDKPYDA